MELRSAKVGELRDCINTHAGAVLNLCLCYSVSEDVHGLYYCTSLCRIWPPSMG